MIKSNFKNIRIAGIACAVPNKKENIFEKYSSIFGEETVQKFSKMTGVISRNVAIEEQTASDLAYEAAVKLLKDKNVNIESIGAIVMVTQSPDYRIPSTACVLHKRLNLSKNCMAFDVNLGCSGYIYGLQIISSIMTSSNIEKALLIAADTLTKLIAPEDKTSCMLFGDAGTATLIEKCENEENEVPLKIGLRTDGEGYKAIIIPAGAYRNTNAPKDRILWGDGSLRSDYDLYMNGMDVFNFTITEVPKIINEFIEENDKSSEVYDCFAMHQANEYILKQISKKCKLDFKKMPISMRDFGNTSVASIPLTLAYMYGNKQNYSINALLVGFGIGLSWGVASTKLNTSDIFPIFETDKYFSNGDVKHD